MDNKTDLDVLYVEDDATDAEFAHAMFAELGCGRMKLRVVTDGEAAAQSLGIADGKGCSPGRVPSMILLDLNVPRIHGKELLKRIKASEQLRSVPVVVLSTSDQQSDVDETYRLGVAGYFTKASSYEECKNVFRSICEYWSKGTRLPAVARTA